MSRILAIELEYYMAKREFFASVKKEDFSYTKAKEFLVREQLEANSPNTNIARIEDGVGKIQIFGELVAKKDPCADLFGYTQTRYGDILKSLAEFANDESVREVVLEMDSPGGQVAGVMDVMNAIKGFQKPISAFVGSMCCSAAYFIASQTGKISASNALSTIGSVGVIASFIDNSEAMAKNGVKRVVITSTDAPEKYQNIATDKGQQSIKERLDEIHSILVNEVATARNVSVEYINSNFGKGGVLVAEKAVKVKMLDEVKKVAKIANSVSQAINAKESNDSKATISKTNEMEINKKEDRRMDLKELQAQYPELYSSVFEMGVKSERVRVEKLMTWSKANPETSEIVSNAIAAGKSENDILPELMAACKTGQASLAVAANESPKDISQAKADVHKQEEPKVEDSVNVDEIAKEAMASIFPAKN